METDLERQDFEEGLPPGFSVIMSKKSAYVTYDIFTAWMKGHFLLRKPSGKVLIVLDGYSSYVSDTEIVDFGNENDKVL
jgi:hypothetical protein